jgi:hypothetical protein
VDLRRELGKYVAGSSFARPPGSEIISPARGAHCRFRPFPLDRMSAHDADQPREFAMQYLLLIYDNEAEAAKRGDAGKSAMMNEYGAFTQSIIKGGQFKAGDGLQPTSTATTVRVRGGKTLTTDGPFAETREQLGGYYLIEAKNLDEATAIAARVPSAKYGSIEVRPVMIYG